MLKDLIFYFFYLKDANNLIEFHDVYYYVINQVDYNILPSLILNDAANPTYHGPIEHKSKCYDAQDEWPQYF